MPMYFHTLAASTTPIVDHAANVLAAARRKFSEILSGNIKEVDNVGLNSAIRHAYTGAIYTMTQAVFSNAPKVSDWAIEHLIDKAQLLSAIRHEMRMQAREAMQTLPESEQEREEQRALVASMNARDNGIYMVWSAGEARPDGPVLNDLVCKYVVTRILEQHKLKIGKVGEQEGTGDITPEESAALKYFSNLQPEQLQGLLEEGLRDICSSATRDNQEVTKRQTKPGSIIL